MRRLPNRQGTHLRVTAYRSGSRVVLEFEPDNPARTRNLLPKLGESLSRIAEAEDTEALFGCLLDAVRLVTGHDRALVYAFDPDGHGTVVSERRADGMASFLGHSFPASDIPPQVRRLYGLNPVRSIPDARADRVPLVPQHGPGAGEPLDMSHGHLRAVAPVHLRYLRNMGVGASLSVAIRGNDSLWGLVASHAAEPAPLAPTIRDITQMLVQMASQRLFLLQSRAESHYRQRALDSRALLAADRIGVLEPDQLVRQHGPEWLELFQAQGLALVSRDVTTGWGKRPSDEELRRVAARLAQEQGEGRLWCTDSLPATALTGDADWMGCCGLLAAPLPMHDRNPGWLFLFRAERVTTRRWAGRPAAATAGSTGANALSPARSFNTWLEQITGRSTPWTHVECQAAVDLAEDLAIAVSVREVERLNARLTAANESLERLAHVDSLTQLWNRYATEQAIDREIYAAWRYGRPCSLLLLDVDHFKTINDRHGHSVGDEVLARLARELGGALRISDHAGRWGGEEFIVLANNTDLDSATSLAERLRQRIAATVFPTAGAVTISVGVAAWQAGDTRRSLVERADRALYRAKQGGRNRVARDGAD